MTEEIKPFPVSVEEQKQINAVINERIKNKGKLPLKVLTFDVEIRNKILGRDEDPNPLYTYCKGWTDYEGMGISFLGAHSNWDDRVTYCGEENLDRFVELTEEAHVVTGFNILKFDIPLVKATLKRLGSFKQLDLEGKVYDIYADIRTKQVGKGWGLDPVATHTLGFTKSGDGAYAPDLWQDGRYADLINYLAQDVRVEVALFNHIFQKGWVSNGQNKITLPGIEKFRNFDQLGAL